MCSFHSCEGQKSSHLSAKKKKTQKQKEDNLHFTNAGVEEKLSRRKKALSLWP
jgi:hypothetical protein